LRVSFLVGTFQPRKKRMRSVGGGTEKNTLGEQDGKEERRGWREKGQNLIEVGDLLISSAKRRESV